MKTFKKEILRTGKWTHPNSPNKMLEVTPEYLDQLVNNYKKTPFVPVFRGHITNIEAEKNPGLILNKNIKGLMREGNKLYAKMDLDEKELEKYNDVSVSVDPDYIDKETGESIGAVLQHVAAVINPYIKGMSPFEALSENSNNYLINLSEIQEMTDDTKVPKEETKVVEPVTEVEKTEVVEEVTQAPVEEKVEVPVAEAKPVKTDEVKDDEVKKEEVKASDEVGDTIESLQKQLREANLKLSEKDATEKYNTLLSEGKIIPAVKEEFIKLHDAMKGTIELSDGQSLSMETLLSDFFAKMPKIISLGEAETVEVEADTTDLSTFKAELRALDSHKNQSDDEFNEWFEKNKNTIIANIKDKKSK